jgi:hypothetical protein
VEIVFFPNTVIDPLAVMIEVLNTTITFLAMNSITSNIGFASLAKEADFI